MLCQAAGDDHGEWSKNKEHVWHKKTVHMEGPYGEADVEVECLYCTDRDHWAYVYPTGGGYGYVDWDGDGYADGYGDPYGDEDYECNCSCHYYSSSYDGYNDDGYSDGGSGKGGFGGGGYGGNGSDSGGYGGYGDDSSDDDGSDNESSGEDGVSDDGEGSDTYTPDTNNDPKPSCDKCDCYKDKEDSNDSTGGGGSSGGDPDNPGGRSSALGHGSAKYPLKGFFSVESFDAACNGTTTPTPMDKWSPISDLWKQKYEYGCGPTSMAIIGNINTNRGFLENDGLYMLQEYFQATGRGDIDVLEQAYVGGGFFYQDIVNCMKHNAQLLGIDWDLCVDNNGNYDPLIAAANNQPSLLFVTEKGRRHDVVLVGTPKYLGTGNLNGYPTDKFKIQTIDPGSGTKVEKTVSYRDENNGWYVWEE